MPYKDMPGTVPIYTLLKICYNPRILRIFYCAGVAQSVEQWFRNLR